MGQHKIAPAIKTFLMKTEFTRAIVPHEVRRLMAFDRKVFPAADVFPAAYWKVCESWWLLVDGRRAGCCAFERHVDFLEDAEEEGYPRRKGSLYIATTGILPKYQGMGFGRILKAWQVSYARYHGFSRIVTNSRRRNAAMIALNRKFGFRVVRTIAGYYGDPTDAAVVMELRLD
jgi:ribosomal protein S18 acetylase RimI-like enzyme